MVDSVVLLRAFFFFNDTATTEIYTLSLHDALPIYSKGQTVKRPENCSATPQGATAQCRDGTYSFSRSRRGTCSHHGDRKSTRLNSSHQIISYAVFCLKKKKSFLFCHSLDIFRYIVL